MKILKLEGKLFFLTAVMLAFFTGWYLGARSGDAPYKVTTQRNGNASAAPTSADPAVTENPAPGLLKGERININTASAADLERLPGIGEKRAADIVAYRKAHGPFRSVEEITNVSGIGEVTLQALRDYITVGEE